MSTKTAENVQTHLNLQVANFNVLYTKLHNYHWYVKGPNFFTLHEKFQELYEEVTLQMDELAERLLALQGKPVATMAETLSIATVKEATGKENAGNMVDQLIKDFTVVIRELKEGMEAAEKAEDEGTADMLLGIKTSLEKHVWMLRAFQE